MLKKLLYNKQLVNLSFRIYAQFSAKWQVGKFSSGFKNRKFEFMSNQESNSNLQERKTESEGGREGGREERKFYPGYY